MVLEWWSESERNILTACIYILCGEPVSSFSLSYSLHMHYIVLNEGCLISKQDVYQG